MSTSVLYNVSVRALCEFAAKTGDLDLRFTPSPTAEEGVAGHRIVVGRRHAGYRAEVSLSLEHDALLVRGRADGYDAAAARVDEIKTFRGDFESIPVNRRALHRAQVQVYAHMLCVRDGLPSIHVALLYYDVDRDVEIPPIVELCTAADLAAIFATLCDRFAQWAARERAHRDARDAWLDGLRFPFEEFRDGQRDLAHAVWRATREARCLAAEAPTGIGKSVATLFPALKAMPTAGVDRVFYLTARGTGRALALDAAAAVARANGTGAIRGTIRVIELVAREKACVHPDRACHGTSCPLAAGFYDRLPAARAAARDVGELTTGALAAVAQAHAVCPYHLGQEMARWCDLVVGDYNHWFDGYPLLAALTEENNWRPVVLVDEAHQLLDRARDMFSARIDSSDVAVARAMSGGAFKRPFARLVRAWNRVGESLDGDYRVFDEGLPRDLAAALDDFTATVGETALLADGKPLAEPLRRLQFDAARLLRLAQNVSTHSIVDVVAEPAPDRRGRRFSIGVRNVVPAPLLKQRFEAAHATVLFSATLSPHGFYADLLGLPPNTVRVDVPSPFGSEQLSIRIARHISTRRRDRDASIAPIVRLIGERYASRPGNYLVFASSHDYLDRVADAFAHRNPETAIWRQARRMDDDARAAFLGRFRPDGAGIGFAVLGGVFAEGVDLPGERLVGAFVATLGMPPFDDVHAEFSRRHAEHFGAGYEYTYLFPGIRKVVQAAGRVIRSLDDRGTLDLIDDRFARREVKALLPTWWDLGANAA